MNKEYAVVLLKPDAMKRRLAGKIMARLKESGLELLEIKLVKMDRPLLEKWYSHHQDKPFFNDLCAFMMECPVLAMVWQGEEAIAKIRDLCGPTDSKKAPKGTIRGDWGESVQRNLIHASDTAVAAQREKELMFGN